MDFSSWIAVYFRRARRSHRPDRPPSHCYRPTLEVLEGRVAPATLTVNTLADSTGASQLSLRDAILAVDHGSYSGPAAGQVSGTFASNDTILFQSGLNGTLSLTTASGPLLISRNVAITANPTLEAITVSGQTKTGVFEVTSPATATIAGLTVTQGKDSTNLFGGIAVAAGAALTVNGCTFVSNQSAGAGGGAILNAGTLTVTDSTFNANSGVVGGAIDNGSGATATLINCTLSGNQATTGSGSGGGVANAGSLTLLNTLVAQNTSAGTDPDVAGAFSSSGHNLIGNATGATGLTDGSNGDQVGSAAPFTGDLTSGEATILNVSGTAGLVVGQLVTDTAGALPAGTVIAVLGPHSITLSQPATKSQTGDGFTSSVYADLGPLQNNGGGIKTMALLPTSPAIDAGANSDAALTVPAADQRGVSRPQAGTVDIGAFEANEVVVTNLDDAGAGSLRDALTQSNGIPGTVVIDFQPGLTGTLSLTSARLEVVHNDWIRGPGASQITVDGNLHFWCFGVDSQYSVSGALYVAIAGLTLTRGEQTQGLTDGRGGAISYRNSSPSTDWLTVKDCVIENSGGSGVNNGGIYAEAGLSVISSQIINNTSGIYISSNGALDISNSWIANNTGNGIFTDLNTVLTNSTISGNGGDAIYSGEGNDALVNCTVTGNNTGLQMHSLNGIGTYTNCSVVGNTTEDARTVVGPPPSYSGNMIFANSIVGKMVVQYGIFTSQGNNIFTEGFPGTLQSSDVVSPAVTSSSTDFNGNLPSGTYYYVIGAVTATGTLTSGDSPVSVFFTNSKVNLSWTAPVGVSGVTGYQIYRGTAIGGEQLIATVSAGTTSFTDTGAAGSSGVPLLLGALANNGGPAPTMAPTANGSVFISNKANPAYAPFLDECGYYRNPILPAIGAFESASATPNTVSLSPASLAGADQGVAYSHSITASGGTGTGYLIGITAGALPPGFTLSSGGALAGTVASTGSFTFTVTGFDSAGDYGSENYTLNVNPPPTITTSSLPIGTENAAYTQAIQTSGGTGPFTWSYAGTLPGGITFDTSTGTFGGTPAAGSAGTYSNIQVTATDSAGQSAMQTYSLTVHWGIGLSPALPADTLDIAYNHTQAITGGSGTYSALNVTGLPGGLTASLSGTTLTISGTPTVTGTFPLGITLHDDGNNSDSTVAGESLTVNAALAVTTTSLPDCTTRPYSQSIATTGGTAPLKFSLSAGALPGGLNLDSTTGLISGTPSAGLGSYPFTVDVTDAAGAVVSQQYTVDMVDTTGPTVTFATGPDAFTSSTTATCTFTGSDDFTAAADLSFQTNLDNAGWISATSPLTLSSLPAGKHALLLRATDQAGNTTTTPAEYDWTIDTTPPTVTFGTGPAAFTSSTTATCTFTGSDDFTAAADLSFQTNLDNAGWASATSPLVLSSLPAGNHALLLRATDQAGNTTATPAEYDWTVDTTPPTASFATGPAALTSSTTATFTFTGSDDVTTAAHLSFQTNLDNGGWRSASSPLTLTGLAGGSHALLLRATDQAGNTTTTPAEYDWTVDATPPTVTFGSGPAAFTSSTAATCTFTGSDNLTPTASLVFQTNLDDAGWISATSPLALSSLPAGNHALLLRATDQAGNTTATPAEYDWTIDTTPPTVSLVTGPAALASSTAATFTFTGSDDFTAAADLSFQTNLDNAGWVSASSPLTLTGLGAGPHALLLRATDQAGNTTATPAEYDWTIDTTPPTVSLVTGPAALTSSTTATFTFTGSDDISQPSALSFQIRLDSGPWTTATSPLTLGNLAPGQHALSLRATDQAGNTTLTPAVYDWAIDTTPPTAGFTAVSPNPRSSAVTALDVVFSKPISGLALHDLKLTLNGATVALSGASLQQVNSDTWQINGLAALTTTAGDYQMTLSAAGSGIADPAGNLLAQNAVVSWHKQLFSDTFNRANSSSLGAGWKKSFGTLAIHSHQLQVTSATGIATVAGAANVSVQAQVSVSGKGNQSAGLVARYGGPGDRNWYWGAVVSSGGKLTAQIWRNVNGVAKLLSSQALTSGTGTLRFQVVGGTLDLFFNGRKVGHATDTQLTRAGAVGVRGTSLAGFGNFLADSAGH